MFEYVYPHSTLPFALLTYAKSIASIANLLQRRTTLDMTSAARLYPLLSPVTTYQAVAHYDFLWNIHSQQDCLGCCPC